MTLFFQTKYFKYLINTSQLLLTFKIISPHYNSVYEIINPKAQQRREQSNEDSRMVEPSRKLD